MKVKRDKCGKIKLKSPSVNQALNPNQKDNLERYCDQGKNEE